MAASTAAAETQWYQPQPVDGQLMPAAATSNAARKRPPIIVRGELAFAGYTVDDPNGGSATGEMSETMLRVRGEQQFVSAFVGVNLVGEEPTFEIGGELHSGGIALHKMPDGLISLLTPSIGVRYVTGTEMRPGLKALMVTGAGLRYCRCMSARPLTVDVRGPIFNYVTGESEPDSFGLTTTFDARGWGAALSLGMGF